MVNDEHPMRLATSFVLAVLGGLGTASAFPPVGAAVGAIAGPALLVAAIRGQAPRRTLLVTATYGAVFQAALLQWLALSIGPAAWVALFVVQALWFAAMGVLLSVLGRLPGWPLWFAAAWSANETLRSAWPFGGLPWGRLGFAVVDSPLESLLPYVGVPALGMLLALGAALVVEVVRPLAGSRSISVVTLGLLVLVGYASSAMPYQPDRVGGMTTAVVQGGVPGDGRQLVANHREVTQNHVEATLALAERVTHGELDRPDLVIWPENSTAVDPLEDAIARQSIETAAAASRAPLLVGGMVTGSTADSVLNQGLVWGEGGPAPARYTKQHPVPFGEYIPFRDVLGKLSPRLDEVPRDMVAGSSAPPLVIGGVPIADAICFDVAYDDVISEQVLGGAQLVVVQTSNASFTGTAQLDQQFAITRARAIETGRATAVASTNGVTALIGPDGEVIDRAALGDTAYLLADLPLSDSLTPAVRYGRHGGLAFVVLAICGLLAGLLRSRRASARRCRPRPFRPDRRDPARSGA